MKKAFVMMTSIALIAIAVTGCGVTAKSTKETACVGEISVVSREDGSGTRGAFTELMGIQEKDSNGNNIDHTTPEAIVVNSTSVMSTTVAGDVNAIGYVSLGSLSDTVKAVKIDGVEATAEHVSDGSYAVSRPFNIATLGDVSEVAQDFLDFILSVDGQNVIEENGYIKVSEQGAFTSSGASGKVVVAGSSSVTPVMEKLKEAYAAINPNATIEIQESDSSTGMSSTIEGICDIGMASRELKDSEIEAGLTKTTIAMDGIAVVVNKENTVEDLTSEQIKGIFQGDITEWSEVSDN